MKKTSLVVLLSTILLVSLTASMVLGEPIGEQLQQKDQDCGKNCSTEDCEPIEHECGCHYEYLSPGPHGPKHG